MQKAEIRFVLDLEGKALDLFYLLSEIEGLRQWWTVHISGSSDLGNVIHFDFAEGARISLKVKKCVAPSSDGIEGCIEWDYVGEDPEWKGSSISFLIEENEAGLILKFKQWNIPSYTDFIARCNFSWAGYLTSLRDVMAGKEGKPFK